MKSIMQQKDGRCYLCERLNMDFSEKNDLEEHHAIFGTAARALSERYGLKVYLCQYHHRLSKDAVHQNAEIAIYVKRQAQKRFEETYPELSFLEIFGKNYL